MNRNILNFVITIVIALVLSLFMDWYSVMVASLITGFLLPLKRLAVFFVPFLAIFILWVVYSYILGSGNDFILAKKIGVLLYLKGNTTLLLVITGLVGGIGGGVAGVLGKQISMVFSKD